MPDVARPSPDRARIAVVGAGVSGLVAAWILGRRHDVTVYEAAPYAGGHTNTIEVDDGRRPVAVDTGFIVYNETNYPGFTRLLASLDVASKPSDMSFSVQCARTGLEYRGTNLDTFFAQRLNLLRPRVYGILKEILRFHKEAPAVLEEPEDPERTLGQFLDEGRYAPAFVEQYIVPMSSAVWSARPESVRDFPLFAFVRFFANHGFLRVKGRPLWRVVKGGSRRYVDALLRAFSGTLRLATPVERVTRPADGAGPRLCVAGEAEEARYDHVVLAVHSDQALRLLADPSPEERDVLGSIPYQENETVLHTDRRLMPRTRRAWASWNAYIPGEPRDRATVTYHMNRLQGLRTKRDYFVSLNRTEAIDPAHVLRRITYHHPVYTTAAPGAQVRRGELDGVRNTWFCGAWWGNGFHEDGVDSARVVTRAFGLDLP